MVPTWVLVHSAETTAVKRFRDLELSDVGHGRCASGLYFGIWFYVRTNGSESRTRDEIK
jgi:hypothetical protein